MRSASAFWQWFETCHNEIASAYSAGDVRWLDRQLSKRISAIQSKLRWEIGPYFDPDFTLVISPNVRENIDLAKCVVRAAPTIGGWHFLPAKPPKRLTRLAMKLPLRSEVEICGDQWSYQLTSYNHGEFFDIEIFTDVSKVVKKSDLFQVTHRLIEALIGELVYLEKVGAVTIYRPSDARSLKNTTPLRYLNEHLTGLLEK